MANFGASTDSVPRIQAVQTRIQQQIEEMQSLERDVRALHDEGIISGDAAQALTEKYSSDSKIQVDNHTNMHTMLEGHRKFYQDVLDAQERLAQQTRQ